MYFLLQSLPPVHWNISNSRSKLNCTIVRLTVTDTWPPAHKILPSEWLSVCYKSCNNNNNNNNRHAHDASDWCITSGHSKDIKPMHKETHTHTHTRQFNSRPSRQTWLSSFPPDSPYSIHHPTMSSMKRRWVIGEGRGVEGRDTVLLATCYQCALILLESSALYKLFTYLVTWLLFTSPLRHQVQKCAQKQ